MNEDEKKFIAEIERQDHVHAVNNEISLYQNTGDARFFWQAFLMIHEKGDPMPQDFLDKLAQWGRGAIQAQTPKEVAVALELSGDGKKHLGPKQSATYEKRWRLASEVKTVKNLYRISLIEAIRAVARNNSLPIHKVKSVYHEVFKASGKESKKRTAEKSLVSVLATWR